MAPLVASESEDFQHTEQHCFQQYSNICLTYDQTWHLFTNTHTLFCVYITVFDLKWRKIAYSITQSLK